MHKKDVFFIVLIIFFLGLFSSRNINYDDYLYIKGAKLILKNPTINLQEITIPFLGETHNALEGTHTLIPSYIWAIVLKITDSLIFLHFFIYILFGLSYFAIYKVYYLYDEEYTDLKVLLFMLSPVILLNVNNFMTDIVGFVFYIYALYFYLYKSNKKYFSILSIIFFIISFLFSYLYLYFIFIVFVLDYMKEKNKRFLIFSLISAIFTIVLLYFLHQIPSPIQAVEWTGSERLFNYHKTIEKFMAFIIFLGFSLLYKLFYKKTYNMFFLLASFLSLLFTLTLCKYGLIENIECFIFFSIGFYFIFKMFLLSKQNKGIYLIYGIYSILLVLFFPMVVPRYMLILFSIIYLVLNKNSNKKILIVAIIFNITLSSVLLYSDMIQTNSYYKIELPKGNIYYTGEWGFREYMEQNNGKMIMKNDTVLKDNSYLIIPKNEAKQIINKKILSHLYFINNQQLFNFPIKIYSSDGAGFYTSETGVLPFVFSKNSQTNISTYMYKAEGNKYLMQYEDRLVLWGNILVIPIDVPSSLVFKNIDSIKLHVIFFDNKNVKTKSDGVEVKINNQRFICTPNKSNIIEINDNLDSIIIKIDSLNNNLYDWVGIYAE